MLGLGFGVVGQQVDEMERLTAWGMMVSLERSASRLMESVGRSSKYTVPLVGIQRSSERASELCWNVVCQPMSQKNRSQLYLSTSSTTN